MVTAYINIYNYLQFAKRDVEPAHSFEEVAEQVHVLCLGWGYALRTCSGSFDGGGWFGGSPQILIPGPWIVHWVKWNAVDSPQSFV